MTDFANQIQDDIIEYVAASNPAWKPDVLQPALKELRNEYRSSGMPDFSSDAKRLAYALAYHPYHALMTFEVLSQMPHLIGLPQYSEMSITSLGSGAGAEVLAFLKFVGETQPNLRRLHITLLDKEPGWEHTRDATLHSCAAKWFKGKVEFEHITADLSTASGRDVAIHMSRQSHLVLAQAILSELRDPFHAGSLLEDVIASLGPKTILLLCDFQNMSGLSDRVNDLDARDDLNTVFATSQRFPMPLCTGLAEDLFKHEDGLLQRRQVTVTARAYSSPRWQAPLVPNFDTQVTLTEGQQRVLDAFSEFLKSRENSIFIIEGPAGTGKTELIRAMIAQATTEGRSTCLMAPTGQAALRLYKRVGYPATTIHSAFYELMRLKSNHRSDNDSDTWPPTLCFERKVFTGNLTIIDEASMIGDTSELLDGQSMPPEMIFGNGELLTDILETATKHAGQIVFIGDTCQLPPFTEDHAIALDADWLRTRGYSAEKHRLTEVVRIDGTSEIGELSESLRNYIQAGSEGIMPYTVKGQRDIHILPDDSLSPTLLEGFATGRNVALAVRNIDVSQWNRRIRRELGRAEELPQSEDRLVATRANFNYAIMNGDELRVIELVGPPKTLKIRDQSITLQDAHLIFTTGSGEQFPIDSTFVVDLLGAPSPETKRTVRQVLWVDFLMRMRNVDIKPGDEEFIDHYLNDSRANSLQLSYAYARTTTRAQGGEWEHVLIDGPHFVPVRPATSRHVYSAVTRATKGLHLNSWPAEKNPEPSDAELAAAPCAIFSEVLRRPAEYRVLNMPTLAVQIASTEPECALLLNVFAKKDGVSFQIQNRKAVSDVEYETLMTRLNFWVQLERTHRAINAPINLQAGIEILRRELMRCEIELSILAAGDWQLEFVLLREPQSATVRSMWKNIGILSKIKGHQGATELTEDFLRIAQSIWPDLQV